MSYLSSFVVAAAADPAVKNVKPRRRLVYICTCIAIDAVAVNGQFSPWGEESYEVIHEMVYMWKTCMWIILRSRRAYHLYNASVCTLVSILLYLSSRLVGIYSMFIPQSVGWWVTLLIILMHHIMLASTVLCFCYQYDLTLLGDSCKHLMHTRMGKGWGKCHVVLKSVKIVTSGENNLSLIHIWRCRRRG